MKMYSAHVEVDTGLTVYNHSEVLEQLEPFHAALSTSARGFAAAQVSVPGESLTQPAATALAVVAAAYGGDPIACEVMPEHEFDVRQGWVRLPELVGVAEAAELLGVSRQRVLQRINEKTLPATKVGRDYVIPRSAVTE